VAKRLRELGVKGILITAAERGYITAAKCGMEKCYCPDGAAHFVALVEGGWNDWNPTHEHAPKPKRRDGHRTVDNSILAHRFCNKIAAWYELGYPAAAIERDFKRAGAVLPGPSAVPRRTL
jgi:hypothetical protein